MAAMSRRSLINTSIGLAATAMLARPYIANAQAKTATVWWVQGFAIEEDIAFKKLVEDYQKASGNKLDYTIIPFAPMRQKIVSAVTSGAVPDLFQNNPTEISALYAWDDKLVDVSDVIDTQRNQFTPASLAAAYSYNNVKKERGCYLIPYDQGGWINHVWSSLVKQAGYEMEDIPKRWDAYYNFFKDVQKKLREQGGRNLVDAKGHPHLDDPQVKEAIIKALEFPT